MKAIAVILSMLFALAAQCSPEAQPVAEADERPAILFLGDSLIAGYRLEANQAPPALFEQKLLAAGMNYRVINGGRSGDTSAGGLARLNWYLRPDLKLKIIAIELGSNDAMRGQPVAEIEKNLIEIVSRIRAFDPSIQVYIFQMHTFPNMGPAYVRDYARIFPRAAKSSGATLLPFPLAGIAGKPELNQDDGIHPTPRGAEIMAENIWQALRPYLRDQNT
ncbi:MAG: arylesterase [Leptospirales bacterium]|nr:arylesterase [Leptospirales bacterium]